MSIFSVLRFQEVSRSFQEVPSFPVDSVPSSLDPTSREIPVLRAVYRQGGISKHWQRVVLSIGPVVFVQPTTWIWSARPIADVHRTPEKLNNHVFFSMVCWFVLINKKAGNRDDKTTRSVVMVKQTLKWLPPLISFAWFVLHQPPQLSTPLGEPFAERKHPISCIFWHLAIIG